MPAKKTGANLTVIVGCGIFAALAGLASVVLPTLLFPKAKVAYVSGHPLVPWIETALSSLSFASVGVTLISMFVLGAILGLAQPRWWPLSCCLTVSLPFLLHTVNFLSDVTIDPTSHNLWPFEFVFLILLLIFLGSPAFLAGFLASDVRGAHQRSRTEKRNPPFASDWQ